MEKGDKPKKANAIKKDTKKPKKKQKQAKQTSTNQNVNVKIDIGSGGVGKKKLLLPQEHHDQFKTRRGRGGPGAPATPHPTSYQIPPPLAPHVVVRNHGDPVQTVASYSPSPIKVKEEKQATHDVKIKVEKKDSDKKKTVIPNLSYRDFVKQKDKNLTEYDSDASIEKLGYRTTDVQSDHDEQHEPKKRSPLLKMFEAMSPIGVNSSNYFTPMGLQNSTLDGSTSAIARKKGGTGGGSQKDQNFYAIHPEILDMSPASGRKKADSIRASERRAAAKNTSKVVPGDFDQIGNVDIGAGFVGGSVGSSEQEPEILRLYPHLMYMSAEMRRKEIDKIRQKTARGDFNPTPPPEIGAGLMRNSYLQVREDDDEEDLEEEDD